MVAGWQGNLLPRSWDRGSNMKGSLAVFERRYQVLVSNISGGAYVGQGVMAARYNCVKWVIKTPCRFLMPDVPTVRVPVSDVEHSWTRGELHFHRFPTGLRHDTFVRHRERDYSYLDVLTVLDEDEMYR